jgi:type I restriction enzyme M protein
MTVELNRAFQEIRNYLAGRAIGITRDRALLHEVVKCLFCYVHVIQKGQRGSSATLTAYNRAFQRIRTKLPEMFASETGIVLDDDSVRFVHGILARVDLDDARSDPVSELYQTFIGSDARGAEGQFFTPTAAVSWLVDAIEPLPGERIIDPACGAGSFLSYTAQRLRLQGGTSSRQLDKNLFGIEKDEYLAHLAKLHIAFATMGSGNIVAGDSIEWRSRGGTPIPFPSEGGFDVVLANPPFGAKIRIGSAEARTKFSLAHRWVRDRRTKELRQTNALLPNPTPQMLFLELCLRLLRPGGRMGVVLPESLMSSSGASHAVQYLMEQSDLQAVIGMPENLFKTSGKGGTHTKTCLVLATKKWPVGKTTKIFMAEAKWCGHDSRGNAVPHNDLPTILKNLQTRRPKSGESHLGFRIERRRIRDNVLSPRYYDPEPLKMLKALEETHDLVSIGDLVNQNVLEISTGDEIGKLAYGTGDIPFVRTSDLSNWEVKLDPKHGVSQEHYDRFAARQDVQEGDILMVRDGTYLIGTCAYVSKYDTRIVYQSHIYKLRVNDKRVISPFLLLAALSSKPVLAQIQAKRFTQDIIDTLGKRILELVLPLPKSVERRALVEDMVSTSVRDRIEARELARRAKEVIADSELDGFDPTRIDLDPTVTFATLAKAEVNGKRKPRRVQRGSESLQSELLLGSSRISSRD